MKTYTIKVKPGERFEFAAVGDYVRVKKSAVELVIENPDANGSVKIEAEQGDDFELDSFERLTVSHSDAATQEVKLLISKGKKSNTSPVSAQVSVSSLPAKNGAINHKQETVSNNMPILLLASNSNRRYFMVQNKDELGVLLVRVDGVPMATTGLRLNPGESLEFAEFVPIGPIYARLTTPNSSASNVEVLEG